MLETMERTEKLTMGTKERNKRNRRHGDSREEINQFSLKKMMKLSKWKKHLLDSPFLIHDLKQSSRAVMMRFQGEKACRLAEAAFGEWLCTAGSLLITCICSFKSENET